MKLHPAYLEWWWVIGQTRKLGDERCNQAITDTSYGLKQNSSALRKRFKVDCSFFMESTALLQHLFLIQKRRRSHHWKGEFKRDGRSSSWEGRHFSERYVNKSASLEVFDQRALGLQCQYGNYPFSIISHLQLEFVQYGGGPVRSWRAC